MKTMTAIIAAALVCSFANATPPWQQPADMSNLPANYKKIALAAVKRSLKDPDSVKTLRLYLEMPPSPLPGGATAVYVVVNAKNGFGGYTGDSLIVVAFKGGSVSDVFSLHSH
jgi:hypothetical protein